MTRPRSNKSTLNLNHFADRILPCILALLLTFPRFALTEDVERAARIRAAFVYYASLFVSTTEDLPLSSPLRICGIGMDPVSKELKELLHEKHVKQRPVVYMLLEEEAIRKRDITIASCDVAYISQDLAQRITIAELGLKKTSLTISESPLFLSGNGLIRIYEEQNRIRFDVNLATAERAGIRFSAEFLALAKEVIK